VKGLTQDVGNNGDVQVLGNGCHNHFCDGQKAHKPQIAFDVLIHDEKSLMKRSYWIEALISSK
jgi:hypothetical protein